jgi:phosphatidylcholine synthase
MVPDRKPRIRHNPVKSAYRISACKTIVAPVFDPSALSTTRAQRAQGWAVHVFTAFGIVVAMLALRDVFTGDPGGAILWLMVTIIIDGVDGPIARVLSVKERCPGIDGYVLDLIIDYVTCVIVPAAFMYQFQVVPNNGLGLVLLGAVCFTSAIWFSRVDMMTDDNWFRGQPAAWNLIAPVLYLMHARPTVACIVVAVLCVGSLTNVAFPHIVRAKFMRVVTLPVALGWFAAISYGATQLPDRPDALRPFLSAGSLYFLALCAVQTFRFYRQAQRQRSVEATAPTPANVS